MKLKFSGTSMRCGLAGMLAFILAAVVHDTAEASEHFAAADVPNATLSWVEMADFTTYALPVRPVPRLESEDVARFTPRPGDEFYGSCGECTVSGMRGRYIGGSCKVCTHRE